MFLDCCLSAERAEHCKADTSEATHDPDFFARLCGEYSLSEEQFGVFQEFSRSMRQCALAFLCVAASNITLTLLQVPPASAQFSAKKSVGCLDTVKNLTDRRAMTRTLPFTVGSNMQSGVSEHGS